MLDAYYEYIANRSCGLGVDGLPGGATIAAFDQVAVGYGGVEAVAAFGVAGEGGYSSRVRQVGGVPGSASIRADMYALICAYYEGRGCGGCSGDDN